MPKKLSTFKLATLLVLSSFASAQVPAYVPQQGLKGFWSFSGNAQDGSNNGYHGTVSNAVLVQDRFNASSSAYHFSGSDEIVTAYSGVLGTNPRAVSFWAKTNVSNSAMSGVAWGSVGTASRYEAGFNYGAPGAMLDGGNGVITYSTPSPVYDNQWHHYVMQINNSSTLSNVEIYQDGILLTTTSSVYNGTNVLNTMSGFTVRFGSIGGSVPHYFVGDLDDIGIWDRALSMCEINQLYHAATLSVVASGSQACSMNGTAVAVAFGLGSPYTFTWLPSGGNSATANNLGSGIHTVLVTSHQCLASGTVEIIAGPSPTLQLNGPVSVCAGSSATITVAGATNYTWLPGGQVGSSIVVNPTQASSFSVTGSHSTGCTASAVFSLDVSFMAPSQLGSIYGSTIVCAGTTHMYSVNPVPNASVYVWQIPGMWQGTSSTNTILITPNTISGILNVAASNACGTTSSVSHEVNVLTAPVLTITSSDEVLCSGESATLTATGANSFTWMPDNVQSTHLIITPMNSTVVTVTGAVASGCESSKSLTLSVNNCVAIADREKAPFSTPFPNPCHNTLSLNNSALVKHVKIYSVLGNQVMIFNSGFADMDVSALSAGMYIVVVSDGSFSTTSRIVKL